MTNAIPLTPSDAFQVPKGMELAVFSYYSEYSKTEFIFLKKAPKMPAQNFFWSVRC
jgi:hypothetical protein